MEALNGRERNHTQGHGEHKEKYSCYGKVGRINPTYEDKKHPRSIIVKNAVHCNEGQFHPTQKPVDLLRYLVLTYTNEGDTVLDNCSGSGTTAVACWREKRHFICFEKDKGYYEKSVKRLKAEMMQQSLF